MCGIAGIFQFTGAKAVCLKTLRDMTAVLNHRGPDEAGLYLDDHAGLGHTRLSIIDLTSGTQPICNEDATAWITYNGEVYNYAELREGLQQKGHRFQTATDTEVVLHLYEEKGPACLDDLNGQFAFAIWNARDKKLFLARDRVGIRPLYYTVCNGALLFASEIKSLFMCRQVKRSIDPRAVDQIFTFWTTLSGRSVFEGIRELPPAHYLTASCGRIAVKRYWQLPFYPPGEQLDMDPEQLCGQIQQCLNDAVRIRLRADVPVGTYLSGGLDSAGVTALVCRNSGGRVKTFGIRFEEDEYDEGPFQNSMVSFLNTDHTELRATNAAVGEALYDMLWHCEKPLLRTAPAPLFLLSKAVQDTGLKVVLTGEGADEVFGGYNIFREAKVRGFWARQPRSACRPELIGRLYPYIFHDNRLRRSLKSFFGRDLDKTGNPFYSHLIRWENTSKLKIFFSRDLQAEIGSYSGYRQLRDELPAGYEKWDLVARAQYLEMSLFLSSYLLSSQGDRVAMAHSLEIRLPYLDHRLMDFMGRVPSRLKIMGLHEKYILKKAFREIVPEEIRPRPKQPYRATIKKSLMSGPAGLLTREMLSEGRLKKSMLFDPGKVQRLVKKVEAAHSLGENDGMALAGIFSAQVLHDRFIEHFPDMQAPQIFFKRLCDQRSSNKQAGANCNGPI